MMKKKFLSGIIKRHPDGFGFFIPEDPEHPDVYIPRQSMKGVMTNDRVTVEVEAERGGERFRGEIVRVLVRGTSKIVGTLKILNDQSAVLKDEGGGWGEDLKIAAGDTKNAKTGEMVAAEIISYPESNKPFTGRVVEIIGNALEPLNDIRRVVLSSHIPDVFTDEVMKEAAYYKDVPDEKDFVGRVDLRGKNLITIDGVTAKDFDDAVLVEKNAQGFLLYVAIADVSHYVRTGSAIDKSAYERGTSVYFPNFCIPMLPEVLSNGLCSLNPHVPRLCLVAEMQFDFTGEMLGSKFYEGVMDSKARVTYGKAQEVIDGTDLPELNHVKENILLCADLAKILMAKRFKEGSLDLEIPETELEIDASGVPIDVIRSERLFSHRLIEEMMLAANVAVAKFLGSRDIPAMYRVHESPNEQALGILEKYLSAFGGRVKLGDGKLQKRLTKALQEFEGKPESEILNILTLRSMSQAKYQMDNVGHFGLGFEWYTHFTSPIRRYPDLIVHRLLKNQIMKNSPYRLMPEDELMTAGTWLSACEQRAAKAERQVKSIKKARFAAKFVGQEFAGIISSVTKFGIFVLLREYDFDGLIRLEDLGSGKLEFDEENLRLVSKGSGFSYSIGDQIKVIVAEANPLEGRVNFMLSDELREKQREPKKQSDQKNEGKSFDRPTQKLWSDKPFRKKEERIRGQGPSKQKPKFADKRAEKSFEPSPGDKPKKTKSLSEFVDGLIARKALGKNKVNSDKGKKGDKKTGFKFKGHKKKRK